MTSALALLEQAAELLEPLDEVFAFTGGASIPLYLEPAAALDVRPTVDVDCVVEAISRAAYYQLAGKLREMGLQEAAEGPICRWRGPDGLLLDMMPTAAEVLGFTNRWYAPALRRTVQKRLPSGRRIAVFAVYDLLASKIEAFEGRGRGDFYGSPDFEDIITVLDGCPALQMELGRAPAEVVAYLAAWFRSHVDSLRAMGPAHLSYAAQRAGRGQRLLDLVEAMATQAS